jgi:hypothetical protein
VSRHILKVTYRSGVRRRVATFYAKVPYGHSYDLTEKLTRLQQRDQIVRFTVGAASPEEIAAHRKDLKRWPEALRDTVSVTGVDLDD